MIKIAYWKDKNNFGDCLTPVLLKKLLNIDSKWAEPIDADIMGCGSYLDYLTKDYSGVIWGSGKMFRDSIPYLPKAKILALRGKLTAKQMKMENITLGDPGLLCKLICPAGLKQKYEVGVINHWQELSEHKIEGHYIDITQDVMEVIKEVGRCKSIISSSLHGLIIADSLNIPRLWHNDFMPPGKEFKFEDYQSVFGDTITPNTWYKADIYKVDNIGQELLKVIKDYYGK